MNYYNVKDWNPKRESHTMFGKDMLTDAKRVARAIAYETVARRMKEAGVAGQPRVLFVPGMTPREELGAIRCCLPGAQVTAVDLNAKACKVALAEGVDRAWARSFGRIDRKEKFDVADIDICGLPTRLIRMDFASVAKASKWTWVFFSYGHDPELIDEVMSQKAIDLSTKKLTHGLWLGLLKAAVKSTKASKDYVAKKLAARLWIVIRDIEAAGPRFVGDVIFYFGKGTPMAGLLFESDGVLGEVCAVKCDKMKIEPLIRKWVAAGRDPLDIGDAFGLGADRLAGYVGISAGRIRALKAVRTMKRSRATMERKG